MRQPCNVVYDLLPLYIDGVCSEESKELVEEHLTECPACREKHAAMTSEMVEGSLLQPNQPTLRNRDLAAKRVLKRIKRRWTLSVAALLLLVPFFWLGVNQYRGEGISYTNLYDHYNAVRFLHALEDRDYEKAFSFVNVRFYYEEDLQRSLPGVAKGLRKEDFTYEKLEDGKYYYTNETTRIPESDIEEWLKERNDWYNQYKDMSYEQFYAYSESNFIRNLQEWEKLGYEITGFSWDSAIVDESSVHEVNELSFNVYIWDGEQTTKSGEISLDGNDKGNFIIGGGSYLHGDVKTSSLLQAMSVWEFDS
ncbi:zf-HC2 domain-containing protein [Paenibacillus sp. 2TAB19]|uniref:zf-HC2 domain-containing protein n=1 Tax=Paenibacillus sp. 2TAB19 TaxID=3233003 RepID=UPI003F9B6713